MNGFANPRHTRTRTETADRSAMIDQQIGIPTRDGHTTTFITHTECGGYHRNLAGTAV